MEGAVKLVFDTNMLMYVEKLRLDVFEEAHKMFGRVEFYVPKQVLEELQELGKSAKNRAAIRVAENLLERHNVKEVVIKAEKADSALQKLAKLGYVVATNDKDLKAKLKGHVLSIRQRKYLARG